MWALGETHISTNRLFNICTIISFLSFLSHLFFNPSLPSLVPYIKHLSPLYIHFDYHFIIDYNGTINDTPACSFGYFFFPNDLLNRNVRNDDLYKSIIQCLVPGRIFGKRFHRTSGMVICATTLHFGKSLSIEFIRVLGPHCRIAPDTRRPTRKRGPLNSGSAHCRRPINDPFKPPSYTEYVAYE